MINFSTRDEIIEVVNKLFVFTDKQDWKRLKSEVFTEDVFFDMSSMGGEKGEKSATEICKLWESGFKGIDVINHLAGNYLVNIHDTTANVCAYATATHYKASAKKGYTREFVGNYEIGLMRQSIGWRVYEFKYVLKYALGNLNLE